MIGTRVGNWLLETELGRGSMGTVYRAHSAMQEHDGPSVAAVKLLTHPLTRDPAFLTRFPGELLGLQRLNHLNIARFYDSGVHAGMPFYACELVNGIDAATLLSRLDRQADQPGLSWSQKVFSLAIQLARALKHGHHRSILHRDLKPSNLMIMDDGTLKVTDFGVVKIFGLSPLSLPNDPMGTAGYLAPEYFTGKPLTRRSDLYSLGGVLYTLLTSRPPFTSSSTAELMHKHCYVLPERPANFVPRLPADFDEFICSLLAKDPTRRPASAAAALEELDRIRGKLERRGERIALPPELVDPSSTHAALPPELLLAESKASQRWSRPRILQAVQLLVALCVVLGVIGFVFFRPRPPADELLAKALPLIQSDDPANWDRAIDEYLEPLTRWHPGERTAEVQQARQQIRERKELRSAAAIGSKTKYSSDAERCYVRGLKLAQAGEFALARQTWLALAKMFANQESEKHWVELAKAGVVELDHARDPETTRAFPGLSAALEDVRKLRSAGQTSAADDMLKAIEFLYRDLPDAAELIRSAR